MNKSFKCVKDLNENRIGNSVERNMCYQSFSNIYFTIMPIQGTDSQMIINFLSLLI